MNRFVKFTWGFFSVIALFLVSAIIFLTVIIDTNTFKPWVAQWVKENKQRTLTFEGDIKLSFYPKINLNLGPVSLSEYQQDKVFASVEKIQLSVSTLALLRRQFNAEGITIQGINATLIRFHDGRTNIDDLIAPDEEPTAFTFDIDSVEIVDTHLSLQDEITNNTMTLSNLNIETGRLQTDLFTEIELTSSGQLVGTNKPNDMSFSLNLEAAQIQLNDGYVTSDPIHLSFKIVDSINHLTGKFSISDLTWAGDQLESNLIHFELTAQNDMQTVTASVDTTFIGLPVEQQWTLPDIDAVLSITHKEDADPPINAQLSGDLIFNPQMETIQMNYTGNLADSPFQADFSLTNFSEKILNLHFYIDQLNLNHFIAPQTPQRVANKKQPAEQLDLSFLRNLNMTGFIHIGQLQIGDIQSSDIQLYIQPANSDALTQ
jgi:uncharacterized protein involved in outer membrane biogenesis